MKFVKIFSLCVLASFVTAFKAQENSISKVLKEKRLVIIMFDGFGMSYLKNASMPHLKTMINKGFFKQVEALMPTVTNLNNASICCGNLPEKNGITGNSYLTLENKEEYMEDQTLLKSSTIFEKLNKLNIKSALIASKKKSIGLLSRGAEIALSPETADSNWIKKLGKPPLIYSPDVNYWTFDAALSILKNKPEIRCAYIHTTDYPIHMWAPSDSNSTKHLIQIDSYLGKIMETAPDAMIMITADHDVNHKNKCIDIENSLKKKNVQIKMAISAERDKYLKHHRGFGGTSFIYLANKADEKKVKENLLQLKGIEKVLTREEAVKSFSLMPSRIGDLIVLGDSLTVFGNLENNTEENLPDNFRTHGSTYEKKVPLIIYNANNLPNESYFKYNYQLTAWLIK